MKSKQFLILAVVAVVVLAIGIKMGLSRSQAWQKHTTGSEVLPDFDPGKVTKFVLKQDSGSVTLEYKNDAWRVAERYDYPAKYETFATFMEDLGDMRVTQSLDVGESQYGRLKVNDPGKDDAGVELTVYGEGGKKLDTLIFGKEHQHKSEGGGPMGMGGGFPDGRYLRLPDSNNRVVLVAKAFGRVDDKPSSWLDDEFFKVGDVKEATLSEGGKELWRASRADQKDDLKLVGEVPDGKDVDTNKLSSIKSAFSWTRFSDVADPALKPEETGLDKAKTYVARQFDGIVYTIDIGKKNPAGKYYITVQAAYDGPTERTPGKDEKPADKDKLDKEFKDKLAKAQKTVAEVNARTKGWVYLVDSWTVENVSKTRDELLKDKPKPKDEKKDATKPAPAKAPAK
jgi:hypothetical protein